MARIATLPQFNRNLVCAVDLETTGGDPEKHEIIQAAFVPLGTDYQQAPEKLPFYMDIRPLRPETVDHGATRVHGLDIDELVIHGIHPDSAQERLINWFNDLELAHDRRLIMLAHNCQFEFKFLTKWLGAAMMNRMINSCTRDSMCAALMVNDHAVQQGRIPPFQSVSLTSLANHFGVNNPKAHNAYADATTGALVYREILKMDILV